MAQRIIVQRLLASEGTPDGLVHLPFVSTSGKKMQEIVDSGWTTW
jgi:hypothetical protein